MKSCDLCGLQEADGEWFAYNDEHNLVVCPVCEEYAKRESDSDKLWQFGGKRRRSLAAAALGKLGGSAPHKRPKDYFSKIAKLPRKKKNKI